MNGWPVKSVNTLTESELIMEQSNTDKKNLKTVVCLGYHRDVCGEPEDCPHSVIHEEIIESGYNQCSKHTQQCPSCKNVDEIIDKPGAIILVPKGFLQTQTLQNSDSPVGQFIVIGKIADEQTCINEDQHPEDSFVLTKPLETMEQARKHISEFTQSFHDLKIVKVVECYATPGECKKRIDQIGG